MGIVNLETGEERRLDVDELKEMSKTVRASAVMAIHAGESGHPGGSLSVTDIACTLYFNVARHAPKNPDWPERDRIIWSAGHKAPALYACLAHSGYYPVKEIMTFRRFGTVFQGHPHCQKTKGVEVSSGSLGQGLGVAVGCAKAAKIKGADYRVYCIMGDGEQQEGSIWESAMAAGHFGLDNLCGVVDKNRLQIDGRVEEVMNIDPLADKYRAFNWHVIQVDGHDHAQLLAAFEEAKNTKGKPTVIIAETVKGKGVSFMEDEASWHGVPTKTREQIDQALADIGAPGFDKEAVDEYIRYSKEFAERNAEAADEAMPHFGDRDFWWNAGETMKVEMDATRMGFGRAVEKVGEDERVVTLHADISNSIRITQFEENHPERLNRVVSVGIAEQNMMEVAAGLAISGFIPVTGTYGVFASGRCWDQLRTTVCYSGLNVKIAGAHGGISVGPDGATHQALEEISVVGVLPNMTLLVPCDSVETERASIAGILDVVGPTYIRFAREATPVVTTPETPFELGKANVIRLRGEKANFVDAFETTVAEQYEGEGEDVALVACGPMVPEAMRAAWILKEVFEIEARVINVHTVKPLDTAAIVKAAEDCRAIVTAEEHQAGGFGNIIAGAVSAGVSDGEPVIIEQVGVCGFGESGDPWTLMKAFGLTAEYIAQRALMILDRKGNPKARNWQEKVH